MTALRLTPSATGGWLALAHGDRALVVGPSGWALADDAWAAIHADRGFEAVIDLLTRGGFAAIPDFVLLEWQGATLRTLLRGPVVLTVTDAAGTHTQDGAGISTWTERTFTGVMEADVAVTGAEQVAGLGAQPLVSGATVASAASVVFGDVPASATAATAQPAVATPAPALAIPAPVPTPAGSPTPALSPSPTGSPLTGSPAPTEQPPLPDPPASAAPSEPEQPKHPDPEQPDLEQPDLEQPDLEQPDRDQLDRGSVDDRTAVPEDTVTDSAPATPTEADALDVSTVIRLPASPSPAATSPFITPPPAGDHDGNTVLSSDIARMRSGRAPVKTEAPVAAPTPTLTLPDGTTERLDQAVLVGRSPSLSKVSGDRMPRLVTVGSGDHDISRNHVQFTAEGGSVVVTDLHSRNGTMIVMPGKSPQKLRAGEPTTVIPGTVVDLGGGVEFTVGED